MRKTVVPGVWFWSVWQPDRGMDFNGFFVEDGDGNLVVDPVAPDAAVLATLRERGVATVVVTNRDHERAAAEVVAATGATLVASALDAPSLATPPGRTVQPEETVHGWRVLGFEGLKTPGEIALYRPDLRAAIVGDAIWGTPAGALTLMPDEKLADPARAALSLRSLRANLVDHLLVGDGACVFGNAYALLNAMFAARDGVATERVNVDELAFVGRGSPPPFGGSFAEAGRLLGAERLAYAVGRIPPGVHYAPYHWHTAEEELFVVLSGTPVLRTPAGTFPLRAGDLAAFPANARGAHRIWNDGPGDAVVLMIANADDDDACFYPDSEKLLIRRGRRIVRNAPQLDYFDGEAG